MERGSDTHSPRLDDSLAEETGGMVRSGHETRAQESRSAEPAGEDQPSVEVSPDAELVGGTPGGMTEADVSGRSELASWIGGEPYPAPGRVLADRAAAAGAPDRIVGELRNLPADTSYAGVGEVWQALGGGVEQQRF